MKKIISLSLVAILLVSASLVGLAQTTAAPAATPKEEVIYAQLRHNGSVERVDVVNSFAGGNIVDYGDYQNLRNLTSQEELQQSGDLIQVSTMAERFFYQGELQNPQLPWNFSITYTLDGKEITAEDVAGKSGTLEMTLHVSENPKADPVFFQTYMLQITMTLNPDVCKQIDAPAATIANAGKNKRLVYTVLPGKEAEMVVNAVVTKFAMAEIEIAAMPYSMNLELPNLSKLTSGFDPLLRGVAQAQSGAAQLSMGLSQLAGGYDVMNLGAAQLAQGMTQWQQQTGALLQASGQMEAALAQLSQALEAQAALLPPSLVAVQQGLSALNAQYGQFNAGLEQAMTAFTPMSQAAGQLSGGLAQAQAGWAPLQEGAKGLAVGLSTLQGATEQIPGRMKAEVDAMMAPYQPSQMKAGSFVSAKNSEVSLVQFVLKTPAIKLPAEPELEIVAPVEKTIWQKLLQLFNK